MLGNSVDTRDGWIASYPAEELAERGLTAEEAFALDEGITLFEVDREALKLIAAHPEAYGVSPTLRKEIMKEVEE
jgi:hypothetical protein